MRGQLAADLLGTVAGGFVDHEMDLAVEVADEPVQESVHQVLAPDAVRLVA
ncbi:hypothetical protein ACFW6F_15745 [Streptomyces sp. NPDC058746]|uniref:hypothetical protein n=1 Tax=Streptomyces sp. NPDC058746 TaxID=3346622 RepID=UPI0036B82479